MRVAWGLDIDATGNAFGFSVASKKTKEALAQAGITYDDSSNLVLHWSSPILYRPWPGRKNILYSVYESPDLPPEFQEAFDHPYTTAIITPSTFCQNIFQRYTKKPVYYCPHGVDADIFSYVQRSWSKLDPRAGTFNFLWAGAANPRKGWDFVYSFWAQSGMWRIPTFRLILKTTGQFDANKVRSFSGNGQGGGAKLLRREMDGYLLQEGNVFLDTRKLPIEALASLYQGSHCLLFPTLGEGFALMAAESAATGIPVIATNYGGHLDFLDKETAYLVKYKLDKLPTMRGLEETGHLQTMARPDPEDFMWQVRNVVDNYARAVLRGKRASERIRQDFTWERVGKTLREILEEIGRGRKRMA